MVRFARFLIGWSAVLCVTAGASAPTEEAVVRSLKVGETAPALETHSFEGMPISFRPPKGKLLLVLGWDTREKGANDRAQAGVVLYRRFHPKGLNVLGICTDSSETRVLKFAQRWPLPWPLVMAGEGGDKDPAKLLGVTKTPMNLLIDPQGKVLAADLEGEDAHAAVAKHLGVKLDDVPMPTPPEPRPDAGSVAQQVVVIEERDASSRLGTAEERKDAEPCKKHLRQISIALIRYQQEHQGELPNWLSELYPKYLQDESLLVCPKTPDPPEAHKNLIDPRMKCSYLYEFCPADAGGRTIRAWKTEQLGQWGDKVPVVRCLGHGRPLSLTFGGEIYFSQLQWEGEFPPTRTIESNDCKVRERLRLLAAALDQYRKDKGEVPAELEDLHPGYVKDKSLFTCPVTDEPFLYQFSASKPFRETTYRKVKLEQLKEFGDYVPILRAKGVLENGNVINLGYGGEIYESADTWETWLSP